MMDTVKVVCKCVPGFESISKRECEELLNVSAQSNIRGRINFEMVTNEISDLQKLRSVSHYWVVVYEKEDYFQSFDSPEAILTSLDVLPKDISWEKALKTWKEFKMHYNKQTKLDTVSIISESTHDGSISDCSPKLEEIDPLTAGEKLSFRVTATRTGKHVFTSMESALHFGGGVNDTLSWKVDLTNFDIEVVLYILHNELSIGIQLTTEDQANRNIAHFGPTTLKANICYCLLKFAGLSEGDIVCDPMCGTGSVSIEGGICCPGSFQIAGENHPNAMEHSRDNIEGLEKERGRSFSLPISVVQWDVFQLPLRTASVDKIVTDLPFGKRIGNQKRNVFLYPVALKEMARICRPHGKAVLLTHQKSALAKAVKNSSYWKQIEVKQVHMGGLDVVVYLILRTRDVFTHDSQKSQGSVTCNKPKEVHSDAPVTNGNGSDCNSDPSKCDGGNKKLDMDNESKSSTRNIGAD